MVVLTGVCFAQGRRGAFRETNVSRLAGLAELVKGGDGFFERGVYVPSRGLVM